MYYHYMESEPLSAKPKVAVLVRDETGRFAPGNQPIPRQKGTVGGRAKALILLDKIIGEEEVQERMGQAIREAVMENPMRFFRQIIMPLLPTEVKMKLGEEGAVTWLSLSTTPRIQGNNPSMTRETADSESSVAVDVGEKPLALPPSS